MSAASAPVTVQPRKTHAKLKANQLNVGKAANG